MLALEGTLVTLDALGCQKKIAQRILSKGADYLLAVKENQQSLYEAIDRLFFDEDETAFASRFSDYAESANKGHGREEKRVCWVCQDMSELSAFTAVWKGLKAIVVLESHRTVGTETTIEYRFYITSCTQTAAYFLKASRDHWHVENKLHWVLDVAFREDESRIRKGDGAENFSILRRIALNLLKQEKTEKTGIENKRSRAGWDQDYLETVLAGLRT
jgi:predicted transposase YbfD/YdcC